MVNPGGQLGSSVSALTNDYYIIAHNLANINTAGYKRKVNSFTRELARQMSDGPDGSVPEGEISINSVFDFSQGSLLKTNRSLDAAINGKGFFVVETPDGPLYTRNGVFQVNSQGQLVDLEGRMISGDSGPIVIPADVSVQQVNIGEDGNVSADGSSLGRLKVVDFKEDEGKLFAVGKNCFGAPQGVQPAVAEEALTRQGYQENSNVERMEEVVGLMTVSRLYETNMKLLMRHHENAKAIIGVANG
jgi:flagellar basal-body rod protein FlgF